MLLLLVALAGATVGFESDVPVLTPPEGGSVGKGMEGVREQARNYSATGEMRYLEDAIKGAIEVLRQDPAVTEAHLFLGRALSPIPAREMGKYPIEELKGIQAAAIKVNPDLLKTPGFVPYQVFRGLEYLGKPGGKSPSFGALFFGIAGALATQDKGKGSLGKAQAEFKEAIRLKPDLSSAHRLLGFVYTSQGRDELALAEAEEAVRLNQDSEQAWSLLAEIQSKRIETPRNCYDDDAIDQAIRAQKQAVRLNPGEPLHHYGLGEAYNMKGMFDLSLFEFREALRLAPEADYHAGVGRSLFSLGQYDEAVTEFLEALRRKHNDPQALRLLTYTLFFRNSFGEAVEESGTYLKSNKDKSAPYVMLCQYLALRHMGRQSEAEKAVREHAKAHRDQVWSFHLLQYYSGAMDGENLLQRAVNRCEQTEAHFYIGYDALLKGDAAGAAGHFREVLKLKTYGYVEYTGAKLRLEELLQSGAMK